MNHESTLKYFKLLARIFGITHSYTDLWGIKRQCQPEQIKNILNAMGLQVQNLTDAKEIIRNLKKEKYQRILAPVRVISETEENIEINCYLSEDKLNATIFWQLTYENGEIEIGEIQPTDLTAKGFRIFSAKRYFKFKLVLNKKLPLGYHKFNLKFSNSESPQHLIIVTPNTCYLPTEKKKYNGLSVQLYSLRSATNWGIGEFLDLKPLINALALQDGDFIGLSPIHAISINNLDYICPYSPHSRKQLNVFNINLDEVAEYQKATEIQALIQTPEISEQINRLRNSELIDYPQVKILKLKIFKELYNNFLTQHFMYNTEPAQEFESFITSGGLTLERYALYEALTEHFITLNPELRGWCSWSSEYQAPETETVVNFAKTHRREIDFYKYLQWQAQRQLTNVQTYSKEKGLSLGFYIDQALSADRNGSDIWAEHKMYALGASIGCPPDAYAPQGQNWGFPPVTPSAMFQNQYQTFIETLRVNMQYAGAIRIDHALSLYRLFWIPNGQGADSGLYLKYQFEDLLRILCLESMRNKCIVVCEDLGTVPDGFRKKMEEKKMLSYKVLFFMKKWDGGFEENNAYPFLSLVTGTTHDMMTLWGYWLEVDLDERLRLGWLNEESFKTEKENRKQEKLALIKLLQDNKFLEKDFNLEAGEVDEYVSFNLEETKSVIDAIQLPVEIFDAIQHFLLATPALLNVLPLEDLTGQTAQVNIPGIVDEYPCWRNKIPLNVEDILEAAEEECQKSC
ncbi:MAG: 4-alpha-glucanotransferase [Deltaproteobacteria bacterium]|jgi:4-alpha-glucanotransferase|nr:4-alpha-glucanotransferase [Deltaproteobacteria bacterium]